MPSSQPLFLPDTASSEVAWLFPGQGAQQVGMGRDLWEASPAARGVFDTADRVLGYSLSQLCFEGPEDRLRDTAFLQPALFTVSLACLAASVEGGAIASRPAFTAGHSLGEYTALVAAGAMSLETGLTLLARRAQLMADAAASHPGTLAAILGLDEATVQSICDEAGADVCNLNLPSQTVIGGTNEAVAKAIELAKARGAQRALELNVSGAFHSRLMLPAVDGLTQAVTQAEIVDTQVPVVANSSASTLRDAAGIRNELAAQIARPVRWHQSVTLMAEAGVTEFVEFGPGRVLTGLVKRLVPGARLTNIGGMADIAAAAGGVAAGT